MKVEIEKVENGYMIIHPNGGFRKIMVAEDFESLIIVLKKEFELKVKKSRKGEVD